MAVLYFTRFKQCFGKELLLFADVLMYHLHECEFVAQLSEHKSKPFCIVEKQVSEASKRYPVTACRQRSIVAKPIYSINLSKNQLMTLQEVQSTTVAAF